MDSADENGAEGQEQPISQEDYEKNTIIKAIEGWDPGDGNGNGIQGLIPDVPHRHIKSKYTPVLIGIIIMGVILIILLTILLFGVV